MAKNAAIEDTRTIMSIVESRETAGMVSTRVGGVVM
jgi:hypothetical protein